ncbi:hypothetical protein PMIN06_005160 [Paraphaeosphaeria minitans]
MPVACPQPHDCEGSGDVVFQIYNCYCSSLSPSSRWWFSMMKSSYASSHWPAAPSVSQVKDVDFAEQAPVRANGDAFLPQPPLFERYPPIKARSSRTSSTLWGATVSARMSSEREHFRASSPLREAGGPTRRLQEKFPDRLLLRLNHPLVNCSLELSHKSPTLCIF